MLRQNGFTFIPPKLTLIKPIDTTIKSLTDTQWYNTHRKQLRKNQILFISQCLNARNTKLLSWTEITNPLCKPNRKTPNWFKELEHILLTLNNRIINTNPTENIFFRYIEATTQKATKLKWVVSKQDNQIIIGKKQKTIHKHRITIRHYKRVFNNLPLEACKGCSLNTNNTQNMCTLPVDTNQLISIPVHYSSKSIQSVLPITGMWHRIRMSPISLQSYFEFKQLHQQQITQQSPPSISLDITVENQNHISQYLNTDTETIANLANIHTKIQHCNQIHAYTDGSLENNKMGIGWIIKTDNHNIEFKACTNKFPFSTRAELMAILTVLTVIPKQTQITIFCDSKAAIQGIQNILHIKTKAC